MDAPRHRPLLLGHRGARARKSLPENTLSSFDRALTDGCDGFEFDVRLTADGAAVICHDPWSGGIEIGSASAQQVFQLPQLRDVLARYQERAFLDIELKVGGIEKTVVSLIRDFPPHRGFVVSSFLPEVLQAVRSADQKTPLGLICETHAELRGWGHLPVTYVIPHYKLLDPSLIHEFKSAGKKVLVWTVNAAEEMLRVCNLGADGIISDDTALLVRTLGPQNAGG